MTEDFLDDLFLKVVAIRGILIAKGICTEEEFKTIVLRSRAKMDQYFAKALDELRDEDFDGRAS